MQTKVCSESDSNLWAFVSKGRLNLLEKARWEALGAGADRLIEAGGAVRAGRQ